MEKTDGLTQDDLAAINKILEDNGEDPGRMVKVLQEVQKVLGYVPLAGQKFVAQRLKIPVSRVHGIVSFYNFFRKSPPGRHSINICMGTACFVKGSDKVLQAFKTELDVEPDEMTEDEMFTLIELRCVGACGLAPVVMVDDKVYGHVKPEQVSEIIDKYRKEA